MPWWQQWIRQPQSVWLRRAIFQIHLWTGVGVGLYVLMISLTGSVLVYRNELYTAVTPKPIMSTGSGPRLTTDQLKDAATRAYPRYNIANVGRPRNPRQAVPILLVRGRDKQERLFDPYTGDDVGEAVTRSVRLAFRLLDLHDNLLAGKTGRRVNAFGAILTTVLGLTGLIIWWPGIKNWRRGLTVHWKARWKRFTWDLHSMMGFWTVGFILVFGLTGIYLGNPTPFENVADYLQPLTEENAGFRVVDKVLYWFAYLHFGRFGGRFPGCGRTCNAAFKVVWAVFGFMPACLFVTGAVMWWNRVLRHGVRYSQRSNNAA